jgi:TrmH family RNA methyltransferase
MNVKTVKKYSSLAHKKYRDKYSLFLAEGKHIVDELLKSDWDIESLLTSKPEIFESLGESKKANNIDLVKSAVINTVATTRTPQEILAVVKIPEMPELDISGMSRIIVADRIGDPGNLGTIIRTARAFDYDLIITTVNSVDIYNPKVVRATQGALFGIDMLADLTAEATIEKLKPSHSIYALSPGGEVDINKIRPEKKSALIIGTEIAGVSKTILDACDYLVRIPHSKDVESLNAAVAAGIAIHTFSSRS